MKCRLCDRPTTPGTGKLCLDCTKALHRARAGSAGNTQAAGVAARSARGNGDDGSSADPCTGVGPGTALAAAPCMGSRRPRRDRNRLLRSIRTGASARTRRGRRRPCAGVIGGTIPGRLVGGFDPVGRPVIDGTSDCRGNSGHLPGTANESRTQRRENVAFSAGTKTTSRAGAASTNANRDASASSAAARRRTTPQRANRKRRRNPKRHNCWRRRASPKRARQRTARRRWRVRWRSAARRLSCRASSASRRCTCSTAKTNGTRIPAACARQETTSVLSNK